MYNKIKSNHNIILLAFVAIFVNFIDAFISFHFKKILLSGLDVDKVVYKFIKVDHIFMIINIIFFATWNYILGKMFIDK